MGQFFNPIELPPRTLHELGRAKEQPITEAEAKKFASSMGAESYVESSSLTQKNLKEVFDQGETLFSAVVRFQCIDVIFHNQSLA